MSLFIYTTPQFLTCMYIYIVLLYYKCITMYYMRTITLRLSDELVEMLNTLPNKSDFIRQAIEVAFNKNEEPEDRYVTRKEVVELIRLELATSNKNVALNNNTFVPVPPDPMTGYPCCTKQKPCKHWSWNGVDSSWVNELTGETRDA